MLTATEDLVGVWKGRLSRLRAFARAELRRVGRHDELDDLVQIGALAWIESGIARGEYLSEAATTAIKSAIGEASDRPPMRRLTWRMAARLAASEDDGHWQPDELEVLDEVLAGINPRLRQVFLWRAHPLHPRLSVPTIAEQLDLSRTRVTQLINKVVRIVRRELRRRGFLSPADERAREQAARRATSSTGSHPALDELLVRFYRRRPLNEVCGITRNGSAS